jgi:branched-chain amino acid aminotransferase/4-amino-4-deoxychorismate lyase
MTKSKHDLWCNGEFLQENELHWPMDDRGLGLGDGLFETLSLQGGLPRHFDAHWRRLSRSAKILGFSLSFNAQTIADTIAQLAHEQDISKGSARILVSRGPGPRGLDIPGGANPLLLIRVFGSTAAILPPLRLALSKVRRCASQPSCQHKTLSHLDMVMSRRLLASGAEGNESLLLDHRGRVSCAGIGNLFWVKSGVLFTPGLDCAILPGTTRVRLLDLAKSTGIAVREGAYWPGVLADAEAVCMSNALIGLREACQVDLGGGQVRNYARKHPMVQKLAQLEMGSG